MVNNRVIFHIDCNSAFLSWLAVYHLSMGYTTVDYRNIPAICGGNQASRYGIVLAKSQACKPFGIQTGEPVFQAKQKCPNLLVIPPDYFLFMQCSSAMMEILKDYSDRMQVFSIDECFLDMTGMDKFFGGDFIKIANDIKDRIYRELGFTVSIGISSNKLLAKMASELKKPNAVSTLFPDEIPSKMWVLPVRGLYMVGEATEKKLLKYGITNIGKLAKTPVSFLKSVFKSWGIMLHEYSNGIESSAVKPEGSYSGIKGIGNSFTSHYDIEDRMDAHRALLSLIETVGMRLRHTGFAARVIQVTIKKSDDLLSYSHQRKLATAIDSTTAIYKEACRIFDEMWKGEKIRHLGVRCTDFVTGDYVQLSLLEKDWEKQRKIDKAVDKIRYKHGSGSVFRSCFLWTRQSAMQGGIIEEFPIMTSIL